MKAITPRSQDFSQWYLDACLKGELADYAPVKGCMVIKPHGYSLWEKIQQTLDQKFKQMGHRNAYFPLLIPKSFLSQEAKHVDGFAKECAVVTHHRLKASEEGVILDPSAKLEEELIIRPTSETIVWAMYKKWIQSYRDLPLLLNQWANVVRWEMRTRPFLRTTEFLWQEGHTAHATAEEAQIHALAMVKVYRDFVQDVMAIPVIMGEKTENERFAGAQCTYTIEGLMQDGKAVQMGTSHDLGQNFAKAFDVTFQNQQGTLEHVYATSWGASTRLIGALVMTHGDDQGLVLPPKMCFQPIVAVPIYKTDTERTEVLEVLNRFSQEHDVLFVDKRDKLSPGFKFAHWEQLGIPLRLELGPKDMANQTVTLVRRDLSKDEPGRKITCPWDQWYKIATQLLEEIQSHLFIKAQRKLESLIYEISSYDELKKAPPGFYKTFFDGGVEEEVQIQKETGITARCIPMDRENNLKEGICFFTGRKTKTCVWFARAY